MSKENKRNKNLWIIEMKNKVEKKIYIAAEAPTTTSANSL